MFNILIMFIAFSTQQRNEVHNNTCCVFYLSNIKFHVLSFNELRDYFVIKQNKTKTSLCANLVMDKNNLCTSIAYIHLDLGLNTTMSLTKST